MTSRRSRPRTRWRRVRIHSSSSSPTTAASAPGGELVLSVDGEAVAGARIERTVPIVFSMSGETFDVGCDTGAPVGPYGHGGVCSAEITGVTLTRLDEPSAEVRRLVAEGTVRAGFSTQ